MGLAYSSFQYIYPGPHKMSNGKVDNRIWFAIPAGLDEEAGTISYLIFPHGAKNSEIIEKLFNTNTDY